MKMQKRTYRKRRTHMGGRNCTPAPGAQHIGYQEAKHQAPYNKSGGRKTHMGGRNCTPAPGAQHIGYQEAKHQAPYNKSGGRRTRRRTN